MALLTINNIEFNFESWYSGDIKLEVKKYNLNLFKINEIKYNQVSAEHDHKDIAIAQYVIMLLHKSDFPIHVVFNTLPFERNDKNDEFVKLNHIWPSIYDVESTIHWKRETVIENHDADSIYVFPDMSAFNSCKDKPLNYVVFEKTRSNGFVEKQQLKEGSIKGIKIYDSAALWKVVELAGIVEFFIIDDILSMGATVIGIARTIKLNTNSKGKVHLRVSKVESSAIDEHYKGNTELFYWIDTLVTDVII